MKIQCASLCEAGSKCPLIGGNNDFLVKGTRVVQILNPSGRTVSFRPWPQASSQDINFFNDIHNGAAAEL